MNAILAKLSNTVPIFQEVYPGDVSIVISTKDTVYKYFPGKEIDLHLVEGEKLDTYSAAIEVIQTGKRVEKEVGSEAKGGPYVVTAVPIYEEGKIVGALSLVSSNKKLEILRNLSQELFSTVEQMAKGADLIQSSSDEVAAFIQTISSNYNEMVGEISGIYEIIDYIKKNALQSKILGLNASIEAARAGEAGKGFSVVANEIQQMGKNSEESSEQIATQLSRLMAMIENLNDSIEHIAENTQKHATSITELRTAFSQIESMTKELFEIAKSQ